MEKFILKNNGKPVKVGDVITISSNEKCSYGEVRITKEILVTQSAIPELVKAGIIEKVNTKKDVEKIPSNVDFYIKQIAKRTETTLQDLSKCFILLNKIAPYELFSILLKEIALTLETKYKTKHNSAVVYVVSRFTGDIESLELYPQELGTSGISFFRSKEDAELAKNILKKLVYLLFNNEESK